MARSGAEPGPLGAIMDVNRRTSGYPTLDPGIFPDCSSPSEQRPEDMYCDEQNFGNYAGVEEHEITAIELQGHIDAWHPAEFESYDELAKHVGGNPILNKIGLIIKVRNVVSKARMMDAKESGVKKITMKTQRVALPRLFDAV